ncbi:MAG: ribonuclease N [Betaproteobacteria bacterium]|nr:ribonuclease N [Betaproteobacteria bacterium]
MNGAWARFAWLLFVLAFGLASFGCARGEPGLAEVRLAQLPPEAQRTLALIQRGGPFPYRRDGAVFGNRERRLPAREQGYYREYTVPTPGAKDRGARRIVAGRGSDYYYTDDHYDSFRRIRD